MNTRPAIGAALLALAATAAPAGAAVIDFAPQSPLNAVAGEAVTVDLVVAELGDQVVSAYDLDIVYDTAVLEAISVEFTPNLGGEVDSRQDSNLTDGLVDLAEVSFLSDDELDALQGTEVLLATLEFAALDTATTELSFSFGPGQDVKGRGNQVIISDGPPEPPEPPEPPDPPEPPEPPEPPTDVAEPTPASLVAALALLLGLARARGVRAWLRAVSGLRTHQRK